MSIQKDNETRQMREFRDRWKAIAEIEAEEQKSASITLRWQQLNSILSMAIGLGLPIEDLQQDDEIVYQRCAKLKGSIK